MEQNEVNNMDFDIIPPRTSSSNSKINSNELTDPWGDDRLAGEIRLEVRE